MNSEVAKALLETLRSPNESDSNCEPANVVDSLYMMGRAIAGELRNLGNGSAETNVGAIEAHGATISKSLDRVADALLEVASAIRRERP